MSTGIGRAEEPDGREGSPLNLANALTASRILLAPVFLVLYVHGDRLRALAAFAAAAATDVLDGLVARALRQHTRLGAYLDPIADKFLAACALVALAATGRLPAWLPVLVITRDLVQLAGAAILRTTRHAIPVAPTRIGKYATFALATTVVLALAAEYGASSDLAPYAAAMGLLAAECVAISFTQYALFFVRAIRTPAGAERAGERDSR
ncbi:CDP-alcohol phosphatidyltransferase family protein [Anaeromyxobacter oryzae]|uniref:CDP-diacylglycerol--glycerol-3-phosphate 3-phosphatidyltransferase n=1 Tax=Anaeromyxobacter oryzae TaxID=2918170 RepID=A0ABN6N0T5_9BACT|nr:CDP-alcohol phosphatidyltransferase family protein [Anaeromyxobacter oryzae]BDG06819.1 CDP-alcohol phosphatidyltransferase [Anaeromyxobacter oryzae]